MRSPLHTPNSFFRSDPDYEPFGLAVLRGLTPGRFGLVAGLWFMLAVVRPLGNWYWDTFAQPNIDWVEFFEDIADVLVDYGKNLLRLMPALLMVTVADNLSLGATTLRRIVVLITSVTLGSVCYWLLFWAAAPDFASKWGFFRFMTLAFCRVFPWAALLTAALFFRERERRTATAAAQADVDRVRFDDQMAEAQLRVLQAQIEPHFLFNSLANIQGLYKTHPEHGRRLIRDLSQYLRAALPQMRDRASTLRRELALASAFLRVLQVRMGDRLKVKIEIPSTLEGLSVPPMMLPTLIENAVKHGVGPSRTGGTVRIHAQRMDDRLRIAVIDDGVGFRTSSGTGIGLANIRARLATLYGRSASLRVIANPGAGVTATLDLPCDAPERDHSGA